jgi:quercetin dioxygenase-like cupin family protein
MNRRTKIGLATLAAGALVAGAALRASEPALKPQVRNLLTTALAQEFTPGREVLVDLVEIPPNTALERHWHPGEEFHYYLEGDARIEVEGQPAIEGKPGTVGHVPFRKAHKATAGPQGAKILVFRVHTQGQPWRYPAPDEAHAHTHEHADGGVDGQ